MVDEATLTVLASHDVAVWTQVDECEGCSLIRHGVAYKNHLTPFHLNTKFRNIIKITYVDNNVEICEFIDRLFNDQGKYQLTVNEHCDITVLDEGRKNFWPLLILLFSLLLPIIGFNVYRFVMRRRRSSIEEDATNQTEEEEAPSRTRIASIDAFRGVTILLMIFVNSGGGGYTFFQHAAWFGFTLADFVFPCFVFIMGLSIAISIWSQLHRNVDIKAILLRIMKRTIILFALGIMLNSMHGSSFSNLRIPGVLQRLAISYCVVALLYTVTVLIKRRYVKDDDDYSFTIMDEIKINFLQWTVITVLVVIYVCLTLFWRYNHHCPIGYQGPGGLHWHSNYFNCTGGAANVIDRKILGENHLYKHSTAKYIYQNELSHDPEGVLGTATSILLTFFGLQAGITLRKHRDFKIISRLFVPWIVVLGIIAATVAGTGWIPICKNLWSLSYVCLSGAIAYFILWWMYFFIDDKKWWRKGKPLCYPGMNSLLIYVGSEICHKMLPFYYDVDDSSHYLLLLRSVLNTFFWFLISFILAKKQIFVTI